jgi:hypothetical protein
LKDYKQKIKAKVDEITVLKEMVKISSNSLKVKDLDMARINKRCQRLEKLVEINKNYDKTGGKDYRNIDDIDDNDDSIEDS